MPVMPLVFRAGGDSLAVSLQKVPRRIYLHEGRQEPQLRLHQF